MRGEMNARTNSLGVYAQNSPATPEPIVGAAVVHCINVQLF